MIGAHLGSLGLALTHGVTTPFWRQVALNAVSPVVAALLGGFVVSGQGPAGLVGQ